MEISLYEAIGEEGFNEVTKAFYSQVPDDEILGPMYPPGQLEDARVRLRDFLVGRFGGPPRYILRRGHPRLRMRHMPFPIDRRARDRWVELMATAVEQSGIPAGAAEQLMRFCENAATFLINRQA
ncbi:MAG: globin [Bryobacterales bacterium]|nr:globin [Bryobacterales bacterium]